MCGVVRGPRYLLISLDFFGTVLLTFRDLPHLLWCLGYRGRKAHPSSKHSNLTTTKSSAKINSHQMGAGGGVLPRAICTLLSEGCTYLGLCFLHRETTLVVGLCRENRRNSWLGGYNLLLPRVY